MGVSFSKVEVGTTEVGAAFDPNVNCGCLLPETLFKEPNCGMAKRVLDSKFVAGFIPVNVEEIIPERAEEVAGVSLA